MLTEILTLLVQILNGEEKIVQIFILALLYGDSKGFIYALKSFIKPFEAPQRSVKIKNQVIFYFNTIFWNTQGGKDQVISGECFSLFQCFATNKHWNKAKKLAWKVLNFKKLICYKCVKYASVNTGLCIFSRIFYAVTKTAQLFDQFIYLFVYLFIYLFTYLFIYLFIYLFTLYLLLTKKNEQ